MKTIKLNPGAQTDFVNNDARYSAFMGGIGAGKTMAGIARGLKFSQQPKAEGTIYGPRGVIAAINYPVLMDVVLPQFLDMVEGTGLMVDFLKGEKKAVMSNGGEILFRSLDRPNWMRGLELSWFFIDEGRHLNRTAWDVLVGRLRQSGYAHAGWVCSTPNGYDWMWSLFHEDSPDKLDSCVWFNAPTRDNKEHLPESYISDLSTSYSGRFYEQEVEGRFVGLMEGGVYPHWDNTRHLVDLPYDPELPLYSFWDFGIGDLGVVEFAQIEYKEVVKSQDGDTYTEFVPYLHVLDSLEHKDWAAKEWAEWWHWWCEENVEGRKPDMNVGDPAGGHRDASSGTSVIDALLVHGVHIIPAPKKSPDYAIRILDNMMAGDRVLADRTRCTRVGAALASHHWNIDDQGIRLGKYPVHDWTSHYSDALRYGATMLLSHYTRRAAPPPKTPPAPGTYGDLFERAVRQPERWLGKRQAPKLDVNFNIAARIAERERDRG